MNASVDGVEAPRGEHAVDHVAPNPELQELPSRDDAVLARGEPGNDGVRVRTSPQSTLLTFAADSAVKVGSVGHVPTMAGRGARESRCVC